MRKIGNGEDQPLSITQRFAGVVEDAKQELNELPGQIKELPKKIKDLYRNCKQNAQKINNALLKKIPFRSSKKIPQNIGAKRATQEAKKVFVEGIKPEDAKKAHDGISIGRPKPKPLPKTPKTPGHQVRKESNVSLKVDEPKAEEQDQVWEAAVQSPAASMQSTVKAGSQRAKVKPLENFKDVTGLTVEEVETAELFKGVLLGDSAKGALLRLGHRNNAKTRDLIGNLAEHVKGILQDANFSEPEKAQAAENALVFSRTYLEEGESVPLAGSERQVLDRQLDVLLEMTNSMENPAVKSAQKSLMAAVKEFREEATPSSPKDKDYEEIFSKLNNNPSNEDINDAIKLWQKGRVLGERLEQMEKDLPKSVKTIEIIRGGLNKYIEKSKQLHNELNDIQSWSDDELKSDNEKIKKDEIKPVEEEIKKEEERIKKQEDNHEYLEKNISKIKESAEFKMHSRLNGILINLSKEPRDVSLTGKKSMMTYTNLKNLFIENMGNLSVSEFDRQAFATTDLKYELSPHIQEEADLLNNVAYMTANEIITSKNRKQASRAFKKVIDLAEKAYQEGQYSLSYALFSALSKDAVHRLNLIEKQDSTRQGKYQTLVAGFNFSEQAKELRQKMEEGRSSVPFLAAYLPLFTAAAERIKDKSSETVNTKKFYKYGEIKTTIKKMQKNLPKAAESKNAMAVKTAYGFATLRRKSDLSDNALFQKSKEKFK